MEQDRRERKKAMLLGSFLGDAFVLGAHWIYNVRMIEASFGDYTEPQEPLPDSYHKGKHLGDYTHYGDQALLLRIPEGGRRLYRGGRRETAGKWRVTAGTWTGRRSNRGGVRQGEDALGVRRAGRRGAAPVLYWVEDPWAALKLPSAKRRHAQQRAVACRHGVFRA